jgi:RNA polymerase sigma-70 factor (ECF subfamily)
MSSIGNRRDLPSSMWNRPSDLPGTRPDAVPQAEPRRATPSAEFAQQIIGEIPFLRRAVGRWHRHKPDADDLVQDTLTQALANAHLWQPGSNLRAWLYTIMHHQFLAAIAKSKRAAALLQICDANGRVAAEDARETRLVLRDVGAVLRRLPAKQRIALQLAGVEGRSYAEVAAAMGLSVGAVRCHLARGRDRLKAAVRGGDALPWTERPAPLPSARRPVLAARQAVFAMASGD